MLKSIKTMGLRSTFFMHLGVSVLLSLLVIGCNEDDEVEVKDVGFLKINVELDEKKGQIATDDLVVEVFNEQDEMITSYDNYSEITEPIELDEGSYYVTVHSDGQPNVAFDSPYCAGTSSLFTIEKGQEQEVTVNLKLAGVKVTVMYNESVRNDFTDWQTTALTNSGNLIFTKEETRSGYFIAGEDIDLSMGLTLSNNEVRTVSGRIQNTQAQDHYIVNIDYSLQNGGISTSIIVNEDIKGVIFKIESGTFSRIFESIGTSYPLDLIESNDGDFVIAGSWIAQFDGFSLSRVMQLDQWGNDVWIKDFSVDFANSLTWGVSQTLDGGYITSGFGGDPGSASSFVRKQDGNGNLDWTSFPSKDLGPNRHVQEQLYNVMEDSDGNIVAVGGHTVQAGVYDSWVVKLDQSGNELWEVSIGDGENGENDAAVNIFEASDKDYIIVGTYGYQGRVLKLSNDGQTIRWETPVSMRFVSALVSSCQRADGTIAILGNSLADNIITTLDEDGNLLSQSITSASVRAINNTTDGGFIVGGTANDDFWYAKLDTNGNILWEKVLVHEGSNTIISILEASDGGFVMSGTTGDFNRPDYLIVKVDADGNLL
ncbi:MAG: DUF4493 domain-containing protein [Cytophagales bacterium]|nr:DUF4493 domain-containing protein [Cytophagales bacterium]